MKKKFAFIISCVFMLTVFILPKSADASSISAKAGVVNVSSGWLNVREEPTANSRAISTLKNGSNITLLSKSGAWWRRYI
jgi:uncharacterized protein YgiM (DUF1202 family)